MSRAVRAAATALLCAALVGCGAPAPAATPADAADTSGPAWEGPAEVVELAYDPASAQAANGATVDVSHVSEGVVFATAPGDVRHKLQVVCGDVSYNYDIPRDGSPVACPVNMGDGGYAFRVMRNVEGSSYVEVLRVPVDVVLDSEFAPFLTSNVYCDYGPGSAVVERARELASGAENEGDVVKAVYTWVCANVTYDTAKAAELSCTTGYVPDPDATLAEGTGVCFDYSALAGAMLRSLGIPCQVVTGYVDPGDLYHAWNMVYIDGAWHAVAVSVEAGTWSRVDTTFGAAQGTATAGSGTGYRDRYVY